MINATAIVLAGGASSRMNYNNKALLIYKGKSFIQIALDHVKDFGERMIVAQTEDQYDYEGVKTISDIYPKRGPLCGIYSGMIKARYDIAAVLSVDTPFISPQLMLRLTELCQGHDAVVPRKGEYCQPLCAAYSKKSLSTMKRALDQGINKPIDIYDLLDVYYMTEEEISVYGNFDRMFRNINTIEDYEKILIQEDI
jgi:molybdenum cofactor guanylyltransferase